jgi:hypothetical protein
MWSDELVGAGEGWLSLAIDSAGNAHAAYRNDSYVIYAKRTGTTWTTESVMSLSDNFVRIALGPGGAPHIIAGATGGSKSLRHASRATGAWVVTTLATVSSTVHSITDGDLAFDSAGGMHVGYFYTGISTVSRTYWIAPGGAVETAVGTNGTALTLDLDPSGEPHMALRTDGIRHAYRTSSGWLVDSVLATVGTAALAVGTTGVVHIGIGDFTAKVVRYATR